MANLLFLFSIFTYFVGNTGVDSKVLSLKPEGNVSVELKGTIIFECAVTAVNETLRKYLLFWIRKSGVYYCNKDLKDGRFNITTTKINNETIVSQLSIDTVRSKHNGTFMCGYQNLAPKQLILNVLYAPKELPYCSTRASTSRKNLSTILTCISADGNPPINLNWFRNGVMYNSFQSINRTNGRASLNVRIAPRDYENGVFTCQITSEAFPKWFRVCHIGPFKPLPAYEFVPSTEAILLFTSENTSRPIAPLGSYLFEDIWVVIVVVSCLTLIIVFQCCAILYCKCKSGENNQFEVSFQKDFHENVPARNGPQDLMFQGGVVPSSYTEMVIERSDSVGSGSPNILIHSKTGSMTSRSSRRLFSFGSVSEKKAPLDKSRKSIVMKWKDRLGSKSNRNQDAVTSHAVSYNLRPSGNPQRSRKAMEKIEEERGTYEEVAVGGSSQIKPGNIVEVTGYLVPEHDRCHVDITSSVPKRSETEEHKKKRGEIHQNETFLGKEEVFCESIESNEYQIVQNQPERNEEKVCYSNTESQCLSQEQYYERPTSIPAYLSFEG